MTMRQLISAAVLVLLAACSSSDPGTTTRTQDKPAYQGREETKVLKATDVIGYDGNAMRKSLDSALDKNEARVKQFEKVKAQNE